MDREMVIATAETISHQLTELINNLPVGDDVKGKLATSVSKLIQLTGQLSATSPRHYQVIFTIPTTKGRYTITKYLPFVPGLCNLDDKFIHIKDYKTITYNEAANCFNVELKTPGILTSKTIKEMLAAGWSNS